MDFVKQNTPFRIKWKIDLLNSSTSIEDMEISIILSCARGRIDISDYIESIENDTITINIVKGLAFVGEYCIYGKIESEQMPPIEIEERGVLRVIGTCDLSDTVDIVDINCTVVGKGYDNALSGTSTNAVQNKVITEELGKKVNKTDMATINGKSLTEGGNIVIEVGGTSATPDWNASKRKAGHIKGRSHYIYGALPLPFEGWSKRIDENGNAIYFQTLLPDNYSGCLIREDGVQEENYVFFGTEWKSLYPAVSADIRINYDSDSGDSVLEIILYRDADSESFLANFINNALFAYGQEDFVVPIAKEFIPNTIARQESVDELREETTALWENLDSGTFPNLTAGDLAGRGESVPAEFGFRASGGKSIKDGRAYIKRIKGNSVVWNQMNESPDFSMLNSFNAVGGASHTSANGVLSVTLGTSNYSGVVDISIYSKIQVNHTYLFITQAKANTTLNNVAIPYISSYGISPKNTLTTSYQTFAKIFKVTANSTTSGPCRAGEVGTDFNAGDVIDVNMYCVIDLTQMFGAGNEPSTIEEFNARVATLGIEDMYAYNEGQVIHCNTESIKSVGDNVVSWDYDFVTDNSGEPSAVKNYEEGKIYVGCSNGGYVNPPFIKTYEHYGNGIKVVGSNGYGVGVFVRVLPNAQYYAEFNKIGNGGAHVTWYDAEKRLISYIEIANGARVTSTENTKYALISLIPYYNGVNEIVVTDFLFSLVHSGWKKDTDAGYQPYWEDTLPLPIIRKYFPDGMKKAGAAHDEIRYNKASGKWEYSKGRIKSVDLGDLDWKNLDASNGMFYLSRQEVIDLNMATHDNENIPTNLISSLYASAPTYDIVNIDKVFRGPFTTKFSGYLTVKDTAYTDVASFKADMADVMLYYEAAEWEWEELDAEDQNFRDYYQVADFGTEMSQSEVPSAAFSADIIYQFNAVDMIREHEMEINELQSVIATMQAQLTSLINK